MWHPIEKRVYWCDIPNGRIFRYDPLSGEYEKVYEGEVLGGFTIQTSGALLLFMAKGAIKQWRSNGELKTILEDIPDEHDSRFNDVVADPKGRVFCGTMPTPRRPGRLYRLDCDGRLSILLEGVGCSNGIAFSQDQKRMYYTDSLARAIYSFDYDEKSGNLRNQQVFVKTRECDGVPDGATVDAEGCVWSAQWDGSCIVRYDQNGKEQHRVGFPVKKVSSLTFGGETYGDLYITTAGGENVAEEGQEAGSLFRLKVTCKGVPEFFSRIKE